MKRPPEPPFPGCSHKVTPGKHWTPGPATLPHGYPAGMDTDSTLHDPTTTKHPATDTEQGTITLPAAAALSGMGVRALRRLIKSGKLPAELLPGPHGTEYRIPAAALAALHAVDGESLRINTQERPTEKGTTRTLPTLDTLQRELQETRERLAAAEATAAAMGANLSDLRQQLEERNRAEGELRQLLLASHAELAELRRLALPGPSSHTEASERPQSTPEGAAGPKDSPESDRPAAASVDAGHPTGRTDPESTGEGLDPAPPAAVDLGPTAPTAKRVPWWRFRLR